MHRSKPCLPERAPSAGHRGKAWIAGNVGVTFHFDNIQPFGVFFFGTGFPRRSHRRIAGRGETSCRGTDRLASGIVCCPSARGLSLTTSERQSGGRTGPISPKPAMVLPVLGEMFRSLRWRKQPAASFRLQRLNRRIVRLSLAERLIPGHTLAALVFDRRELYTGRETWGLPEYRRTGCCHNHEIESDSRP